MTLHYGDTSIRLKEEVNIDSVKDEVELAVRNRGGWVRVDGIKREVHVFVSAGQYISLTPTPTRGTAATETASESEADA